MDYTISITNKCNLRCSYCYERHLNTEYGSISPQVMHKIMDFINRRNDAGTVYLFGGEPLLYKEEVMYFCDNLKAEQFVITTNGILLDEMLINWCAERGVIINMSHDGAECAERGADRETLDTNLKLLLRYQPET
ncbi:MAG: radical SAM protein, partial [Oscillospiraceae bacterium]|nr:radical SAM protein [Oscillospiraceae bacterium]